jgi:hypothetical protein
MLDRSRNLDRTVRLSDFADILVEPASWRW